MAKQTNNTSTSKVVTNSATSEDEDGEEKFVSYLNNTKSIWRASLHLIWTSVLDVGNNYTRITKGVERQLWI